MTTPRKSSKTKTASADVLTALGSNLDTESEGLGAPVQMADRPRVKIILEENENIPPSGQFFQLGGTDEDGTRFSQSYMLRPGEEVAVPQELLDILDNAVMSTPVVDSQQSVIGYRDKLRFPYRVIRDRG